MAGKRPTSSRLTDCSSGDFRYRQNLIHLTSKPGFLHKSGEVLESCFESKVKNNFDPAFNQPWEMQQRKGQSGNSRPDGAFVDRLSYVHPVADSMSVGPENSRSACGRENYSTSSTKQNPKQNSYPRNSCGNNRLSVREYMNRRNSPYKIGCNGSSNGECSVSSAYGDNRIKIPHQLSREESRSNRRVDNEENDSKNPVWKRLKEDASSASVVEKYMITNQDDADDDTNKSDDDVKYEYGESSIDRKYHAQEGRDHVGYQFNDFNMELVTARLPRKNMYTTEDTAAGNVQELSLYPTYEDITRPKFEITRPNITGPHDSVEHYLHTQLYLLREDCIVEPLRAGLREYQESKFSPHQELKFKYGDLRLYPNTRFQRVEKSRTNEQGILLNFDPQQKIRKFVWKWSNRFAVGSLLVFTCNDFRTFFFGTVLESDSSTLQCGEVLIALVEESKFQDHLPDTPFLMAETEMLFEPYRWIMKQLKDLDDNTFPMKEYIVDGRSRSKPPAYLYLMPEISIGSQTYDPFTTDLWPSAESLGLDPFQYAAYKAALTREFCVIQGLPGTGKTFLGLKIVHTIWKNAIRLRINELITSPTVKIFREFQKARENNKAATLPYDDENCDPEVLKLPILIVCHTNNALDQFLKGVLKFTKKVIRVDGQSCGEVMTNFSCDRSEVGQLRKDDFVESVLNEKKCELEECSVEIERISRTKECIEQPIGILRLAVLNKVMHPNHSKCFSSDEDFQTWLLADGEDQFDGESNSEDSRIENREADEVTADHMGIEDLPDGEESTPIVKKDSLFAPRKSNDVNELECSEYFSLTVNELGSMCQEKIDEHESMKKNVTFDVLSRVHRSKNHSQIQALQTDIRQLIRKYKLLKNRMENPNFEPQCNIESLLLRHPLKQSPRSRWLRYWFWILQLREYFANRLTTLEELLTKHRNKIARYEECLLQNDLRALRRADIVGVTTAGAARLGLALKTLEPAVGIFVSNRRPKCDVTIMAKIGNFCTPDPNVDNILHVVIEEAAQMLEAKIVACLTRRCLHVILIGDCEQLQPSAAVSELSRKYNIEISLFKRMLENGMDCPTLKLQHRMRPEVSCLVSLIYPNLENHESVIEFESVKGVKKNVFFIDHEKYEQVLDEDQTKQNIHEAQFVIALAKYLIQQGYNPDNITILTTCIGQMFLLRQLKKEISVLSDVKCDLFENFEGGENEIILLSLVCSNGGNKVGIMNINYKVGVALSRAKKGLYIIGNMDCLTQSSELWVRLRETFEKNNAIGNALKLYCSKHDESTMVASVEDFARVKEGGCDRLCDKFSACGHQCRSMCHNHKDVECREPCTTVCWRNHPCELLCYETCKDCDILVELTLLCRHVKRLPCNTDESTYVCDEIVDDVFPSCKHKVKRKCHQKVEDITCVLPCRDRLDCGHACTRNCHKNDDPDHKNYVCRKLCGRRNCPINTHACEKSCFENCDPCPIKISKKLNCGHEMLVECSTDISTVQCLKKCEKVCERCDNPCRKLCWEDCGPCQIMFEKTIPECGHVVSLECFVLPTQEWCNAKCERLAPCGHPCQSMCRKPCSSDDCQQIVKLDNCINPTLCGHYSMYALCHPTNEAYRKDPKQYLPLCQEPCGVVLECGDLCGGTCGECWQGRLHRPCNKGRETTLFCGHICKYPCRQLCPPCSQPCSFSCKHSECRKECSFPCVLCKENCDWKCEHSRCNVACGELCDREPCMEPCPKQLPCTHDCIGFCGEPCPPLCRVCNPEVTELVFGYEDEPNARFVLLEDCHHTIESKAIDLHLSTPSENGEIALKGCPRCKTPISKTLRFMNFIKQTNLHIINIKKKISAENDEASTIKKDDLFMKLQLMQDCDLLLFTEVAELQLFLVQCFSRKSMYESQQKQIPQQELAAIEYYHRIFCDILSRAEEITRRNALADNIFEYLNCLLHRLQKTTWCINRQLMSDVDDELRRYHKMVDFWVLTENPLYVANKNHELVSTPSTSIRETLFGVLKFTEDMQKTVQNSFDLLEVELVSPKPLTSAEKRIIDAAMRVNFYGGGTGHWFTCSKGHYYVITECGGATQKAKCPECGEEIGGTNHSYVPTARLASDMDGATVPAHSSGRNMPHHVAN